MMVAAAMEMGLAVVLAGTGQPPASVAQLWRGVSRVVLVCGEGIDPALCDVACTAARAHTALRVERAPISTHASAEVADRGTVLLTLAAEEGDGGRQLVAVARRALEIDEAEAPARQAAAWPATPSGAAPATPVITALLTRILPGRVPPDRPKGIRPA